MNQVDTLKFEGVPSSADEWLVYCSTADFEPVSVSFDTTLWRTGLLYLCFLEK